MMKASVPYEDSTILKWLGSNSRLLNAIDAHVSSSSPEQNPSGGSTSRSAFKKTARLVRQQSTLTSVPVVTPSTSLAARQTVIRQRRRTTISSPQDDAFWASQPRATAVLRSSGSKSIPAGRTTATARARVRTSTPPCPPARANDARATTATATTTRRRTGGGRVTVPPAGTTTNKRQRRDKSK